MSHPHTPDPVEDDDDRVVTHTEADEPSMTRFGPRPVPPGHRRPPGPAEARRIPPHGELAPDGSRPWPRPSGWARWLVWGGTGIAAAALTIATVEAGRMIADRLGDGARPLPGRGAPRQPGPARPGPAVPGTRPMPGRAATGSGGGQAAPFRRPGPPPRRAERPSLVQEVEATTAALSNSVENVMRSVGTALTGVRGFAAETGDIVRELGETAALLRGILSPEPAPRRPRPAGRPADASDEPSDPRTHRL